MDARGLSGYALAKATGIPQSTVSRKLNGTAPFDFDDAQKVCAWLGIDAADLVAWAERRGRPHPTE